MTPIPLIPAQLVPPRIKKSLQRTRLRDLGFAILSHRVTTVIAPAGYGKSVWISSLLKEPGWPPTAWLSLDHYNSEVSALLYHLVHALKRIFPEFGSDSLRTLNSVEDVGRDWFIAASTLIEEIPPNVEFVLVLDDLHLIDENPTVRTILEHLVRWLPSGSHLVFISRNNLSLNLYRVQLSGELLEIPSNQLLFSPEETGQLLTLLGLDLKNTDLDTIHTLTEGWAVGLRLLGIHLKQADVNLKMTLSALKQSADLYSYLSNELLDDLTEIAKLLLDSSLYTLSRARFMQCCTPMQRQRH